MSTDDTPTQIMTPPPGKPRKPRWRRWYVITPAALAAGIIMISALGGHSAPAKAAVPAAHPSSPAATAPAAPAAPATPAFAPQTLLTLSGNGSEDTASFTVPAGSGNWKIIWTYNEGSFGQSVNFGVSSEDFHADVNKLGAGGSGTEYVYGDPGTHHLSVISEGNWTLQVVTAP